MGVEIERKFLVEDIPDDLSKYDRHRIEQGYLNVSPAIRVRREDDKFYMTYKGLKDASRIGQEEYNLFLDEGSYLHLLDKADGNIIRKDRYIIPLNEDAYDEAFLEQNADLSDKIRSGEIKIELDIFDEPYKGYVIAEVEFPSEEAAAAYRRASWFKEDVTGDYRYSNAYMSRSRE